MICSISGQEAVQPVVSPRSGAIFEKKHILNYVFISGKDPINDEPLKAEELIDIKAETPIVPPTPPSFNSIPSMLASFQNEWDALALEVFTLRKQLHKTREELSAALYHYDAATRVASRALKERDEAKDALQQLSSALGNGEAVDTVVEGDTGVENIPVEEINRAREELFQMHKSQKPTLTIGIDANIKIQPLEMEIQPFKKLGVVTLDPVFKKLAVSSSSGSLVIYEDIEHTEDSTKINHRGKIDALNFVQYNNAILPIYACKSELLVGSKDLKLKHQHKDVSNILVHPKLNDFLILIASHSWSFVNVNSSTLYKSEEVSSRYVAGDIHVDGALFAVANEEGVIDIYNITTVELALKVNSKHKNIRKISFAPNGYWMLVASFDEENSSLEIVDLRKNKVAHTMSYEHEVVDFLIDPSSSLIITVDSSNKLAVHRFLKKDKKWTIDLSSLSLDYPIKQLALITDVNDESFVNESRIKFIGVGESSPVRLYELSS